MELRQGTVVRGGTAGFTLTELVVVIAIIAVIVGMLVPVFIGMRQTAQRTTCVNNMGQLFLGFQMYANDFRGFLPFTHGTSQTTDAENCLDWVGYVPNKIPTGGSLWPYVQEEKVYLCPSDSKRRSKADNPWLRSEKATHSYAMPWSRECQPLATQGANKALLVEESELTINDGKFVNDWETFASRHRLSGRGKTGRSGAGAHIVFADGHVEFFLADEIIGADHEMFE